MKKAKQDQTLTGLNTETGKTGNRTVKHTSKMSPISRRSIKKTKSKIDALQDAVTFIHNLKEDNISVEEMRFNLIKMGVSLNEEEFQDVLKKAGMTEDRMVNFNSFMNALGKSRHLTELSMLKDTIQAIDKIEGDKVVLHELPSFMKSMGIYLSEKDFQEALNQVSVDAHGKIVVKDFIKILTNTPYFSELSVMKDTIQAVSYIKNDKVDLQDLRPTLKKMGVRLNAQEYDELIKTTSIDDEGKVDIGKIVKQISKTQRFLEMEVLNNAVKAYSQLKDNKVKFSDVEPYLNTIGVHLAKSELDEITKSLNVSYNGTVDINELISALKGIRRFANFLAVHDAILALKYIKDRRRKHTKDVLNLFGWQFANQVISQVLKTANVTEAGQAKFNEFLRALTRNPKFEAAGDLSDGFTILSNLKNDKIGVNELQAIMKNFNINLPPEEVSEALAFCSIDEDGKVNLKDFLTGVTHTKTFVLSPELQLTCLALSKLKGEHFDLQALESILDDMDLPEAKDILQEVMMTAQVDSIGKVNFREFIRIFTLLPQVPETMVLTDTFTAMSNLKDRRVHVKELDQTLISVGIHLLPDELQQLQNSVTIAGDGTVSFEDIMMSLIGTQSFAEYTAIQKAFNVFSKICREKVKIEELPEALKDLGITMTEEELQVALASATPDESGRLNETEVMKILSKAPCFSEFQALQNAMKFLDNIRNKMTVAQLEETLNGIGVHLPSTTFNEVVKSIKMDENGNIDFQDFLLALGETDEFHEVETLQRSFTLITAMDGSRMTMNELEIALQNLGICLKPEELEEAMRASYMDSNGTITLKDFLTTLAEMEHFSDSLALHSAINAFGRIKDEKVDVEELETVVECLGISISNTELDDALRNSFIDESGKVDFKEFLMNMMENERFSGSSAVHDAYGVIKRLSDGKIEVSQLKDAVAAIGIVLSTDEMRDTLKNVTVDSDGKVNLKEFMKSLPNTQRFFTAAETEGAMKTLQSIKQDKADIEELNSIMRSMDLNLSSQEIHDMLQYVPKNDDGTVSVKDCIFVLTKTRRPSQSEKDKISIKKLDSILSNMGIDLTKREMQEILRNVPIDVNAKINLNDFMKVLRGMQQPSFLEEDVIAVEDVTSVLFNMGFNLSEEDLQEAMKQVTVDDNGRVNMDELMKSANRIHIHSQAERKMIDLNDLSSSLIKMGIHLTEKEMVAAFKDLTVVDDGKVNLKNVLESVMAARRPSTFERDRVAVGNVNEILVNLGISLTEEEMQEALKHAPLDAEGKLNFGELLKAVRSIQLHPPSGKLIDIDDLSSILANMNINLTEEEMEEAMKYVYVDADGKVNLKKALESVMATRHPSTFERDRVSVEDVSEILASIGIHPTKEEMQAALKYVPPDADSKVNLGELTKVVRVSQTQSPTEKMVYIDDLGSSLAKMSIHLTRKEMEDALKSITVDANGKVSLKKALESVIATRRPSSFERDRVAVGDLNDILENLGFSLTEEMLREALQYAPLDDEGKVNLGEFMKAVQLQTGKMVELSDLSSCLAKMSIYLSEKEMREALKPISIDADGKVNLKKVLESIISTRDPSIFERERVPIDDLNDILENLGIDLSKEKILEALKSAPPDAEGKVNLGEFMKAAQLQIGKMVEIGGLRSSLAKMSIHLTEKEMKEALKTITVGADGKVNLKKVLENVLSTRRPSTFERDRIHVRDLSDILDKFGISLTEEKMWEALKYAPPDAEGKVNLREFMKAVQLQPGKMVEIDDLSSCLSKMSIHLSENEMEEALKPITVDADGYVNLKKVLESVILTRRPSAFERDRVHVGYLNDILDNLGISLTEEKIHEALKYDHPDAEGRVNLGEFMKAVQLQSGKMVELGDLSSTLAKMSIHLSEREMKEALKPITIDADGKVNLKKVLESIISTRLPSAFERDRVPVEDLIDILDNLGINPTEEKLREALRRSHPDAEGRVNLQEFMNVVELQSGKMVELSDLNSSLAKMSIHLSEKEMKEALRPITVDADGKVDMKKVLESIISTRRPSAFERDRVPFEDLTDILDHLGISLSKEKMWEALKHAPPDAEGKVNLGEFMKAMKAIQLKAGKMVQLSDLSSSLANMSIHLSEKEMKEALKPIKVDADGKVSLKKVLESVISTRRPSAFERDKVSLGDLTGILNNLGIRLSKEKMGRALKHAPLDAEGRVNLGEFLKAIQLQSGKMVELSDLSSNLAKMSIHLSEKEMKEALKPISIDADGKVNLKKVLESVISTRQPSAFERDRVPFEDLTDILDHLGISLSKEKMQEALKQAPPDAEGKVNLGEFWTAVKAIQLESGKMVELSDLSSSLAKMSIHLSEKEMKDALKHITIDADGKVNLKEVLENVISTRRPSVFERDRVAVEDLNNILENLGIRLTEEKLWEILNYARPDAKGKVNLGEFMKVMKAIELQPGDIPGDDKTLVTTQGPSLNEKQMIAVEDLGSVLANQGIHLNDEELKEALMHVEVNADGKVRLDEFLKGLREVQGLPPAADGKMSLDDLKESKGESQIIPIIIVDQLTKDKKEDIDTLDAILNDVGIQLSNKQLYDTLKYAPKDANGKVNVEAFKKILTGVFKGPPTGKRVDISILDLALAGMGLSLTPTELQEALKLTVSNKDNTVNFKDFMWAVHDLPSIQDKRVPVKNLNSILTAMGIYFSHEELEDVLNRTPINVDDMVNLRDFIKACTVTLQLYSKQGKHLSQMSNASMVKLPKVTDKQNMQSVSKLLTSEAAAEKTKFKAARSLNQTQIEAFRIAYDLFSKDLDGTIDLAALETTAYNMGIGLTEEEAFDELVYADTDGDGRVSFIDFLNTVTDNKRFDQAVAPRKNDMETVDARGILFFELLSKMVESSLLSKKATETIVSYYRRKFLESTGKRAWQESAKQAGRKKLGALKRAKSSSLISAYAGFSRIGVMKDKELESYVHQLQANAIPSDSPYAKTPIFPLIPNQDYRMPGKPKKDIAKLEKQRRTEPLASFEDHFFQKRKWLQESKSVKCPDTSLALKPELGVGKRRLTIDNLQEIRQEVKKATDSYRRSIAIRERNKSLKLWRRLRGGEIGLETGNPSFYQTFSTYSWSWNVCQELLTPRELQEYDNKLYQDRSQSAITSDKLSSPSGRQRISISSRK